MTPQDRMKDRLAATGIAHKEINCYGRQIVVTTWGEDAARRFAGVLARFAKVRGMIKAHDENVENRGTNLRRTHHQVWRVYARV